MYINNAVSGYRVFSKARARNRANAERGFSLVEAIVFIVIVSVALAGVLGVMNLTTQRSADPLIRKQTIAVAESLLDEISLQNFTKPSGGFPGPYTQANRQYFDSIGDYNGFTFPTVGIYPIDGSTVISGLSGYKLVSVSVVSADLGPAGNLISAASNNAKLITVTVQGPDGVSVALSGYRTAYGL